jgi:hypothetical protein
VDISSSWVSRHVNGISERSLLTTGEATGAATTEVEAESAATRPGSRNISSRKTRETAGKNQESRLYFDCCRRDGEVL